MIKYCQYFILITPALTELRMRVYFPGSCLPSDDGRWPLGEQSMMTAVCQNREQICRPVYYEVVGTRATSDGTKSIA